MWKGIPFWPIRHGECFAAQIFRSGVGYIFNTGLAWFGSPCLDGMAILCHFRHIRVLPLITLNWCIIYAITTYTALQWSRQPAKDSNANFNCAKHTKPIKSECNITQFILYLKWWVFCKGFPFCSSCNYSIGYLFFFRSSEGKFVLKKAHE